MQLKTRHGWGSEKYSWNICWRISAYFLPQCTSHKVKAVRLTRAAEKALPIRELSPALQIRVTVFALLAGISRKQSSLVQVAQSSVTPTHAFPLLPKALPKGRLAGGESAAPAMCGPPEGSAYAPVSIFIPVTHSPRVVGVNGNSFLLSATSCVWPWTSHLISFHCCQLVVVTLMWPGSRADSLRWNISRG